MIVVTGGAGFIGLNFVHSMLQYTDIDEIVNLDALTYSSNKSLLPTTSRHVFIHGDINDRNLVNFIMKRQPEAVIHFAAETHVDRSIKDPTVFMSANFTGTFNLLESVKRFCPDTLFVHISTDEVYGDLGPIAKKAGNDQIKFTEESPYQPNNPYSASKAASDHLVRSWGQTYNLRTIITHCSNNYGPYQHTEKLIPKTIFNALNEISIPVYGQGQQIRDWIHVADHCAAIRFLLKNGKNGEIYNIGSNNELKNISLVHKICVILDTMKPRKNGRSYAELIDFVQDRPAHDSRYAIDTTKINSLGWAPTKNFEQELTNLIESFIKK